MNAKPPPPSPIGPMADVQALIQTVASASDGTVAEVVEYLDTVPARDTVEIFVAPLRPRLRHLRVRRRYDLARLLITPLEPLLTETHSWKPGDPAIPRNALRSITAMMIGAMGPDREALDKQVAQLDSTNPGAIVSLGSQIWPAAARALADASAPAKGIHGMLAHDYGQILRIASVVLAQAKVVEALAVRVQLGTLPDKQILLAILRRAAKSGPDAFAAQLKTLLGRLPASAELVAAAREIASDDPALRRGARGALAWFEMKSRAPAE